MQVLGFSVNLLHRCRPGVAMGIVVDDAIVVIENVERIMAQNGIPPPSAATGRMHR